MRHFSEHLSFAPTRRHDVNSDIIKSNSHRRNTKDEGYVDYLSFMREKNDFLLSHLYNYWKN